MGTDGKDGACKIRMIFRLLDRLTPSMSVRPTEDQLTAHRLRIISGGQTGVDRGALDAALQRGWPCGGTCPKGRRAENGRIPERYPLVEAVSGRWDVRTRINVDAADATLILVPKMPLQGGTRLTAEYACEKGKPMLIQSELWDTDMVCDWLDSIGPETLNVAGPRESGAPGIGRAAASFIGKVLDRLSASGWTG